MKTRRSTEIGLTADAREAAFLQPRLWSSAVRSPLKGVPKGVHFVDVAPSISCSNFANYSSLLMESTSVGCFSVRLFLLQQNGGRVGQELPVPIQLYY